MRIAQLQRPMTAAAPSLARPTVATALRQLQDALSPLSIAVGAATEGRRYASVKTQGQYKIRDTSTIAKKMGAKKTGDNYVITGNIIYKQRGTIWHPGENAIMGRDHTIHAGTSGWVRYYRDPRKHTERQYIGVVFNKEDKLPYPPHAVRRRKLGLTASVIPPPPVEPEFSASGLPTKVTRYGTGRTAGPRDTRVFKLRDGYSYQEEPWRLGSLIRTEKRKRGSRHARMKKRRILKMREERQWGRVQTALYRRRIVAQQRQHRARGRQFRKAKEAKWAAAEPEAAKAKKEARAKARAQAAKGAARKRKTTKRAVANAAVKKQRSKSAATLANEAIPPSGGEMGPPKPPGPLANTKK